MKILITGNIETGKTTLAKVLSEYYEIKHYDIAEIVYDKVNKKRETKEQTKIINKINKENKSYIIEGKLEKNHDFIINLVDQIIYLNLDKKEINKRIKKKYIKQKLHLKETTNINNLYRLSKEFDSKEYLKRINKYPQKIIIITNKKELKKYLNSVYNNNSYI